MGPLGVVNAFLENSPVKVVYKSQLFYKVYRLSIRGLSKLREVSQESFDWHLYTFI